MTKVATPFYGIGLQAIAFEGSFLHCNCIWRVISSFSNLKSKSLSTGPSFIYKRAIRLRLAMVIEWRSKYAVLSSFLDFLNAFLSSFSECFLKFSSHSIVASKGSHRKTSLRSLYFAQVWWIHGEMHAKRETLFVSIVYLKLFRENIPHAQGTNPCPSSRVSCTWPSPLTSWCTAVSRSQHTSWMALNVARRGRRGAISSTITAPDPSMHDDSSLRLSARVFFRGALVANAGSSVVASRRNAARSWRSATLSVHTSS